MDSVISLQVAPLAPPRIDTAFNGVFLRNVVASYMVSSSFHRALSLGLLPINIPNCARSNTHRRKLYPQKRGSLTFNLL